MYGWSIVKKIRAPFADYARHGVGHIGKMQMMSGLQYHAFTRRTKVHTQVTNTRCMSTEMAGSEAHVKGLTYNSFSRRIRCED